MKKISYFLKSSKLAYNIYYYLVSGVLKLLGMFLTIDDKTILFNSFGGKKYDDSPRYVYEAMLRDPRFQQCRLIWALQESDKISVPGRAKIIKADSFAYFIIALRAKIWITNSSIERGLNFKKKNTICFNTWHGTPIKLMGYDIKDDNQSFRSNKSADYDIMLAQGQYDVDVFSRAFRLPVSTFRITGYPRNDVLANYTQEDIERIKSKLGIDQNKTVLLYAPTFREFTKGSSNEVVLNIPMNLQYWQDKLGDKFVILFRAHYEVAKHMNIDGYSAFLDMTSYPDLNELMIVADALISDYSSIYFDFSVTHKPMYCFAYDYEEYMANRGMYLELKDELPCTIHVHENTLIADLLNFNEEKAALKQRTIAFQQRYVTEYGQAAKKSCDILAKILNI